MSIEEKQKIKEHYYTEAIRYMDNAKETLKKAGKDGDFYNDRKYVRTATGTAYKGVLIALDGYFLLRVLNAKRAENQLSITKNHYQRLIKNYWSILIRLTTRFICRVITMAI